MTFEIPVDPGKHQHIRSNGTYHFDHCFDLRVFIRQDIAQKDSRAITRQFGMEEGDPQAFKGESGRTNK